MSACPACATLAPVAPHIGRTSSLQAFSQRQPTMSASVLAAARPVAGLGAARRLSRPQTSLVQLQRRGGVAARALGDRTQSERKVLRREDEPEEYWQSAAEKEGKSPFQDPLAQIGILAIFFPFIFLAVAIAFGWVDLSGGRM